jgi:hypothetical protein
MPPVVFTDDALVRILNQFIASWPTARRVGLYSNPRVIDRLTRIDDLEPTTFSGYGGELPFPAVWTQTDPTPYALAVTAPLIWTHDGGPDDDYVAGYYVVDDDGVLLFAQPGPSTPKPMINAGQVYRVDLNVAAFTKYGGIT